MRKTIKKTLALLLTALMLFGTAIPMVSATESTSGNTFKDPATAQNGELLWEVNFNDKERYDFALTRPDDEYSELKISEDGKTAELITKQRSDPKNYAFVGAVDGLPFEYNEQNKTLIIRMYAIDKNEYKFDSVISDLENTLNFLI